EDRGSRSQPFSKSQIPNPKFQIPRSRLRRIGIWVLGFGFWDFKHVNNVLPPFYVVAIRKIRTKVAAAAFLAAKRGARNHQPHREDGARAPALVVGRRRRGEDSRSPRF